MKISLPETKLRKLVKTEMEDQWMMTWHEDREITPGVPDLHYVMKDGLYRVGWLELKAIDKNVTRTNRICVEPSQHQYIRRWHAYMPIDFLIRIKSELYLVPGRYHQEIPNAECESDIAILARAHFNTDRIADFLPQHLKNITRI